jgi:hypothetical protein
LAFYAPFALNWESPDGKCFSIRWPAFQTSLVGSSTSKQLDVRVLYAVDHRPTRPSIAILGVAARDDAYLPESDYGQRICNDYDRLGIPCIPRQH